jgi:hypothetical protein
MRGSECVESVRLLNDTRCAKNDFHERGEEEKVRYGPKEIRTPDPRHVKAVS